MDRIIYIDAEGELRVITPSPEALVNYTLREVAEKDIPAGLPFLMVDQVDVPSDRAERQAWTVDPATLVDGVGSISHEFPPLPVPEPVPEV